MSQLWTVLSKLSVTTSALSGEKEARISELSERIGGITGVPSTVLQRRAQSLSQISTKESSRLKTAPVTGWSCLIGGNAASPPGTFQNWTTPSPRQVRRRSP